MTDKKSAKHEQAEIFAQTMKRLREIEWLESSLIELSRRGVHDARYLQFPYS